MKRFALWGVLDGNDDWEEMLLLSDATAADCERIKALAARDGWGRFRMIPLSETPDRPDFVATIK
jgi:hypothetical protein